MDNNVMFLILVIVYVITVVFFVTILNKKDKQFAEERKDYLNRLMSKNTNEYIKLTREEPPRILSDGEILGDDRMNGVLN